MHGTVAERPKLWNKFVRLREKRAEGRFEIEGWSDIIDSERTLAIDFHVWGHQKQQVWFGN